MSAEKKEVLVKITSVGTISIPKQFRKYLEMQKGDYVKVIMDNNDQLIVRKISIE